MNKNAFPDLTRAEVKAVIARKGDLHKASAAKFFGVPEDQVTQKQLAFAKSRNFTAMYTQPPHVLRRPK